MTEPATRSGENHRACSGILPRMSAAAALRSRLTQSLEQLRLRLASPDASLQLAVLGLVSGLVTALVVAAFRLLIELSQQHLIGMSRPDDYVSLPGWARLALPVLGGLGCALVLYRLRPREREVGINHVLVRLGYYQGRLPASHLLAQFAGGALAIISGHSVGREGPGVHLGAATSSLVGQALDVPNNTLRSLVACGTAAAIAASFNTPLAGVVFAMEVVMMEYTIFGFVPVILAAVTATVLIRLIFGSAEVFAVGDLELVSLLELPYLLLVGLAFGALAGTFVLSLQYVTRRAQGRPLWLRLLLAGLTGGLIGLWLPQTMGIGYDSLNLALAGQLGIGLALALLVGRLVASVAAVGLGIPGGLIGPTLVMGATGGLLCGSLAQAVAPGQASDPGFYALIGMTTMMGAVLQAPLAALISMLELSGNHNILLPGMLTVVTAMLVNRRLFGRPPVHVGLVQLLGMDYRNDPVSQSLRRIGVASAMERSLQLTGPRLTRAEAQEMLSHKPLWLLIRDGERRDSMLAAADLARHLSETEGAPDENIDLLDIPGTRLQAVSISLLASLQEAHEALDGGKFDAAVVQNEVAPGRLRVYGVLTREQIDKAYR